MTTSNESESWVVTVNVGPGNHTADISSYRVLWLLPNKKPGRPDSDQVTVISTGWITDGGWSARTWPYTYQVTCRWWIRTDAGCSRTMSLLSTRFPAPTLHLIMWASTPFSENVSFLLLNSGPTFFAVVRRQTRSENTRKNGVNDARFRATTDFIWLGKLLKLLQGRI